MFTISLDKIESSEKTIVPFSAIKVVDARFDKSNIGCVVKDFSFKGMTKNKAIAAFSDSLQTYLPSVFEKMLTLNKGSADTVVMLVKQFRIADHLFNSLDTYHTPETILTFSISFYKKANDHLSKILSLEDSWSKQWNATEDDGIKETTTHRNETIVALLSKIFQNKNWSATQTSFSWTDMENGLQKRFQLPVYANSRLNVGLYKTFEEFKNNNPSFTYINLGMKEGELVQVLDENNAPIDLKNYWGACDGANRYIVFRGVLNRLGPIDKSFRFSSYRMETKDRHMLATSATRFLVFGINSVNTKPGMRVKQEYFYVNMDNGRIYLEELIGTDNYERAIKILNNVSLR